MEACPKGYRALPIMAAFSFVILGFHSDNGSEYINHQMAKLLEKLRVEQTKSRSRQTNDNALAESKNASTVRKHWGYSHIPQHFAGQVNAFTTEVLSPYLNFHRPCHFPTEYTDKKGRIGNHADRLLSLQFLFRSSVKPSRQPHAYAYAYAYFE